MAKTNRLAELEAEESELFCQVLPDDDPRLPVPCGGYVFNGHIDLDNNELRRFLQGRPTLKELNEKYPADGRFNSDSSKDFDESFIENMAQLSRSNITLYETDKLRELVESVEKATNDNKE